MFENPRRGRQARNFTTNVPKILDLKSSSEQIFSRKLSLGAPENTFSNSSDSQLCRNDCRQFSVFGHPCVDLYRIWKRRIYLHRQERHRNHSFLVGNLPSYSFALEVTFATLDYRVALLYSRKVVVTADSTLALAENSNIAVD